MSTILVTVRGPDREADLVAPAETPVTELLPSLLEAAVGGEALQREDWELAPPGRPAFAGDLSLAEHGVLDGGVLQLRQRAQAGLIDREPARPQAGGQTLLPLDRTRVVVLEGPGPGERLRAALRKPRLDGRATRPGRSAAEHLSDLDRLIAAPAPGRPLTIALLAAAPRAGASTVTALLGSLIAGLRDERVVAAELDQLEALAADAIPAAAGEAVEVGLRRGPERLLELDLPAAAAPEAPDRSACAAAIARLQGLCELLLVDCGSAPEAAATCAALDAADQVIVVYDANDPEPLNAPVARLPADLDAPWFAVVNRQRRLGARVDLERLQRRLPGARGLVDVHRDPVLARRLREGEFSWHPAPVGRWPRALRELAVLLSADWVEPAARKALR